MIRHIWSVLCQSASFDSQTGSVSLQNIVEMVTVLGEPSAEKPGVIFAELVSLWWRGLDGASVSGKVRIYYEAPTGERADDIILDLPSSSVPFHHTRLSLPGFPVVATGLYNFYIELKLDDQAEWELVSKIPLIVASQPLLEP